MIDPLSGVAKYYSEKLAKHGDTPLGVDWNSEFAQSIRFEQLIKIVDEAYPFSINDLGCGYGAFFDYLKNRQQEFTYVGIDVSENMVNAAMQRFKHVNNARFVKAAEPDQVADYGVASGIFNVRLDSEDAQWLSYIKDTLETLDMTSSRGFAFNCLTSYSDVDRKRSHLYYAYPLELFDFCRRHFSREVALMHDYGLYEFTILVRKHL